MSEAASGENDLQRQLDQSEEVFRLLVESVKDYSIYMIDPQGQIMTWNSGAERIEGCSAKEAIGTNFSRFYPPESKTQALSQLKTSLDNEGHEEEGWRIRADGGAFWASVTLTPVREKDILIGFSNVTRDLTQKRQSNQREQIFKLLVSNVADYAIFMLDLNGNVLTWNEGAEKINGYKASEIVGKHFSQFYTDEANSVKHPEYELEVALKLGRYEESGWRVRKDGSQFWANVILAPVYDNKVLIGFAKVTRDLTERRLFEKKEEVFRLLVSGVSDYAIFMLTPEGNVMTWNEGAQRIKGYKADDVIGKHFSIFYTKESQNRRHPQSELELAKRDGRYEEEGWRLKKDGSLLWASVVITPIYDNGKLFGFAKVTRDLTQRLLADQEREASAKMLNESNIELRHALEVKSRFLSTVSHEVRTPMGAILGMAEVLSTEDMGEDTNSIIKNIFVASQRLLQLLNNLLDSAKLESGEIILENEPFPIRSVLGDIRQLISRDAKVKDLRVVGVCDSRIPEMVVGDEQKLRQIMLNLAHNAVKFTHEGEVNISAELVNITASQISVRFIVTDTGIGIKDSDKHKIFQPFSQAEDSTKRVFGGSGLGLNISKQLVERMGGVIKFVSEYGKGSSFSFEIVFNIEGDKR